MIDSTCFAFSFLLLRNAFSDVVGCVGGLAEVCQGPHFVPLPSYEAMAFSAPFSASDILIGGQDRSAGGVCPVA